MKSDKTFGEGKIWRSDLIYSIYKNNNYNFKKFNMILVITNFIF